MEEKSSIKYIFNNAIKIKKKISCFSIAQLKAYKKYYFKQFDTNVTFEYNKNLWKYELCWCYFMNDIEYKELKHVLKDRI